MMRNNSSPNCTSIDSKLMILVADEREERQPRATEEREERQPRATEERERRENLEL
jgi:hypothetical protein